MNEQTAKPKLRFLISAALLVLFLIILGHASIMLRWEAFSGIFEFLLAIFVWIIWLSYFIWIMVRWTSAPRTRRTACILGGVLASIVAGWSINHVGEFVRAHEIKKAADAGLYKDCMRLLLNWPSTNSVIFQESPEFAKLPASVKMLKPVYLEDDNMEDTNLPPNVGICKNGFGGFAIGVRVFKNDQDANNFKKKTLGGCQRIASGIYVWWHPT